MRVVHHVGDRAGHQRLMAENTLVTILGGLAVALGQESVAAREHRRVIVEMLSALTAGPGASDHLWAANGDWVIVVTSAPDDRVFDR